MESINIEEIMDSIRAEIKEKGLKDDQLEFEDMLLLGGGTGAPFDMRAYKDELEAAHENSGVLSYRALEGNAFSKVVKKVIRRAVAFYIESIVDDQNKFNKNVCNAISMNVSKFEEDAQKVDMLEKKLYECEKKIKELEKRLSDK